MTRYEHIKEMTIDELTDFFDSLDINCKPCSYCSDSCKDGIKDWLEGEDDIELIINS